MARRRGGVIASMVRMLCVRSASLTRMTRRSRTIASSILRKLSACASSRLLNLIWSSLVTASTSSATSAPKRRRELVLGRRRVFDDVVEDGRDDRVRIEPQVREDRGGGYGMRDVGLAGKALLTLVGRGAELGGFADALDLLGRQVGLDVAQQLFETRSASCRREASPRSEDA